jgi:hypothetical protein
MLKHVQARRERRFEPGLVLQHSRDPSRCYAEGLSVGGDIVYAASVCASFASHRDPLREAVAREWGSCVPVRPRDRPT